MTRVVHKAFHVAKNGGVSALCFTRPRAINMRRSTWTLQDSMVTCPKCRAIIDRQKPRPMLAMHEVL